VALVAAALLAPSIALASSTQESMLQDDNQLVYNTPQHVTQVLNELVTLGVQRVRVSVIWAYVAPDATSFHRPSFNASDPAAYPARAWKPYDTLLVAAEERGMKVEFNVTGPEPYWAAQGRSPYVDYRKDYLPSASEFGRFVTAVGRRYSGTFVGETPPPPPPPPTILGIPIPGFSQPPAPAPGPLPRVDFWGIYNEPDEGGWLTPQWRKVRGKWVEAAPAIYRHLLDASWNALRATGHGSDTILVGELAARGSPLRGIVPAMKPSTFIRALYCVDRSYRRLTGAHARDVGCPAHWSASEFVAAHPALFRATGFGHHPYDFHDPPNRHVPDLDELTLADMPRLYHALDRIFVRYGQRPGIPVYVDEWGYKSDPPNPYAGFTQAQQAAFINEGEYMAYNDPRIRSMSQFLLVDAPPKKKAPVGSADYWSTFQTGLVDLDGSRKPSYDAYRLAIWLPSRRPGSRVTIWGHIRPGLYGSPRTASLQFEYRRRGARTFTPVRAASTTNPQGYFIAGVALTSPGWVRFVWTAPDGTAFRSRTVKLG
jgi:hypothetical protein